MAATKTRAMTGASRRPKPKKRGGFTIKTPSVPVTLHILKDGIARYGCPHCRLVLYQDRGSPHPANVQRIERHVPLCGQRKALLGVLAQRRDRLETEMAKMAEMAKEAA